MNRLLDHLYIASTIAFTVYSQLIMRWQVGIAGPLPNGIMDKVHYVIGLLLNPWVMSSLVATFLAGISWMLAMTKFEISYVYPWVSFNFVLMLVFGVLLFGESFSQSKLIGTLFVMVGIVVLARS